MRPSTRAVSFDGLLVPHVRAARPDEGHVGALVVGRDLERAPGARRVLLEDQRDLPSDEPLLLAPLLLGGLQLRRQVDQIQDLVAREVLQREKLRPLRLITVLMLVLPFRRRGKWDRSCSGRRRGRGRAPGRRSRGPRHRPWRACVRRLVALVGDDHTGCERDDVVAVVPLVALGLELVAAGGDDRQVGSIPSASPTSSRNVRSDSSALTPPSPSGRKRIGRIW